YVPYFTHMPGNGEGEVISKVAGQIDVKPTLLHMLGLETDNDIYFGNDLFHDDRKDVIALRNGDFISEEYVYASGICYDRKSGEQVEVEESPGSSGGTNACSPIKEEVEKEFKYSDDIIYGDLFRFMDFN